MTIEIFDNLLLPLSERLPAVGRGPCRIRHCVERKSVAAHILHDGPHARYAPIHRHPPERHPPRRPPVSRVNRSRHIPSTLPTIRHRKRQLFRRRIPVIPRHPRIYHRCEMLRTRRPPPPLAHWRPTPLQRLLQPREDQPGILQRLGRAPASPTHKLQPLQDTLVIRARRAIHLNSLPSASSVSSLGAAWIHPRGLHMPPPHRLLAASQAHRHTTHASLLRSHRPTRRKPAIPATRTTDRRTGVSVKTLRRDHVI